MDDKALSILAQVSFKIARIFLRQGRESTVYYNNSLIFKYVSEFASDCTLRLVVD